MNATVAVKLFARAVIRKRRIPFKIEASPVELTKAAGKKVFSALFRSTKERGIQGMNLDDINEEIRRTRIRDDR